jgi:hypothetical protein
LAVFFCVFLVAGAGIAQAAHIHGDWLPHNAPQLAASPPQGGAVPEDSCPLCMAMHSALPVSGLVVLLIALLLEINLALVAGRKPDTPWHFAAFSRPPPLAIL